MQLTDRLKDGGLENLISGVKNFLPANKLLPVTRLTEALMDPSAASNQSLQETDEYIFLDPRAPRNPNAGLGISGVGAPGAGGAGSGRARRMAFSEGIVFVVGGAGYVEYGNLEEWTSELEYPFLDSLTLNSPSLDTVSCHQGTFTHRFLRRLTPTVEVLNFVIPSPTSLSDKCRTALVQCFRDARERGSALSRVSVWPRWEDDSLYDIMSDACNASGITFSSQ